ncbi:outer membrane receptor for ferric coprogen and ferric-rhodotorulic acid [Azomonas macrocytogenes]|uniref:Outer membrane receptor for ferric coprogen and ferric-rhodotorulic acid n=1 Tax=Azomonas macrocytogenes TaxID=69962 RepID=A0A839T418_AZOMA|nr:outer membrane receptor for ferric coprogen and ferric-rhodotorulic acid [Azomonas macrocytogenes]
MSSEGAKNNYFHLCMANSAAPHMTPIIRDFCIMHDSSITWRQPGLPSLLALAIALSSAGLPVPVQAQSAGSGQLENRVYDFDIAAQPLDDALAAFSRTTRIQVLVSGELTRDVASPGLQGSYGRSAALSRLLAGSGLVSRFIDDNTVTLEKPVELNSTINLDAMTVVDNQLGTITENTKSYTPGTIATATRLVLTPRETPQTVTVVTRQHMDDFNLTNIDKVMDHTPGISRSTLDSERSDYYARGFAITNFQYDGIPIQRNSAYSSGNTLSDMIVYDRVEVIKGASGLTTGAGTPGATLNLVRKKPTAYLSGHVTAEAGTWDNYRTELDIGNALNESGTIRGRIAGSFQDKQSFQDHYKRINKAYYGIMEFDLSPQDLLTMGFDYNKSIPTGSSWGGVPIFDSEGNRVHVSRSFNPGASWSTWEQYSQSFFTQWDRHYDNGWISRAYYTFQVNGYDAELGSAWSVPDVADGGSSGLSAGQYRGKTKSHAGEIYASGPFELFGREHELVLGVSYYRNHWKGKSWWDYTTSGTTAIPNYNQWKGEIQKPDWGSVSARQDELTQQRAAYATFRFKPTDDLSLILGTRVTNYHLTRDNNARETGEMTPFAGVVYDLNDNYSLYASYTEIFMPTPNKDRSGKVLEPDKGDSYEAGIKGEWFNGRLKSRNL